MPLWRRLLKIFVIVTITAVISYYSGVIIAIGIAMLPVIYIHGIWLPRRHGVNGRTGKPREVLRSARLASSGKAFLTQPGPSRRP
jgi:hypothetical protein